MIVLRYFVLNLLNDDQSFSIPALIEIVGKRSLVVFERLCIASHFQAHISLFKFRSTSIYLILNAPENAMGARSKYPSYPLRFKFRRKDSDGLC